MGWTWSRVGIIGLVLHGLSLGIGVASGQTSRGCDPPDVLFALASDVQILAVDTCGGVDSVVVPLPGSLAADLWFNRDATLGPGPDQGSVSAQFYAHDGRAIVNLKVGYSGTGEQVSRCGLVGCSSKRNPELTGLGVYVRGDIGTRFWVRGRRSARLSVKSTVADPALSARFAGLALQGDLGEEICQSDKTYDDSDGVLDARHQPVRQLGEIYRRVLFLPISAECRSTNNRSRFSLTVSVTYEVGAGLGAVSGGGPSCAEYRPCDWEMYGEPDFAERNNCYNYALGRHANPFACTEWTVDSCFARPGGGNSNAILPACITCDSLRAYAMRDGLIPTTAADPAGSGCKVALFVIPGVDYHWVRQDADGFWSHKMGGLPPTRRDALGSSIRDPEEALFCSPRVGAVYDEFCGYFQVPKGVTTTPGSGGAPFRGVTGPSGSTAADFAMGIPDTSVVMAHWFSGMAMPTVPLNATQEAERDRLLALLPTAPDPHWTFAERDLETYILLRRGIAGVVLVRGTTIGVEQTEGGFRYVRDARGLLQWCRVILTTGRTPDATKVPRIKTEEWAAWVNRMPPAPGKLHLTGKVWVGNPGLEATLTPREVQGRDPTTLMLDLKLVQKPGRWAQVLTQVEARYDGASRTSTPAYRNVAIYFEDEAIVEIPVGEVW